MRLKGPEVAGCAAGGPKGLEAARRYQRWLKGSAGGPEGPEVAQRGHMQLGGPRGCLEGPEADKSDQRQPRAAGGGPE